MEFEDKLEQILQEINTSGMQWKDPDFPPTEHSLWNDPKNPPEYA
jgi:hypothetical protein